MKGEGPSYADKLTFTVSYYEAKTKLPAELNNFIAHVK